MQATQKYVILQAPRVNEVSLNHNSNSIITIPMHWQKHIT